MPPKRKKEQLQKDSKEGNETSHLEVMPFDIHSNILSKLKLRDQLSYRLLNKVFLEYANYHLMSTKGGICKKTLLRALITNTSCVSASGTFFSREHLLQEANLAVINNERLNNLLWFANDKFHITDEQIQYFTEQYLKSRFGPGHDDLSLLILQVARRATTTQKKQIISRLISTGCHASNVFVCVIKLLDQKEQLNILKSFADEILEHIVNLKKFHVKEYKLVDKHIDESPVREDKVTTEELISRFLAYARVIYPIYANRKQSLLHTAFRVLASHLTQNDVAELLKILDDNENDNVVVRKDCLHALGSILSSLDDNNLREYARLFWLKYDCETPSAFKVTRSQLALLMNDFNDAYDDGDLSHCHQLFSFCFLHANKMDLDCLDDAVDKYLDTKDDDPKFHNSVSMLAKVMHLIGTLLSDNTRIEKYIQLNTTALSRYLFMNYYGSHEHAICYFLKNIALLQDKYTPNIINIFIETIIKLPYLIGNCSNFTPLEDIVAGVCVYGSPDQHHRLIKPVELKIGEDDSNSLRHPLIRIISDLSPHTKKQAKWFYAIFLMYFDSADISVNASRHKNYIRLFSNLTKFLKADEIRKGIEIVFNFFKTIKLRKSEFSPLLELDDYKIEIKQLASHFLPAEVDEVYNWLLKDAKQLQKEISSLNFPMYNIDTLISITIGFVSYFSFDQLQELLKAIEAAFKYHKENNFPHQFRDELLLWLFTRILHDENLSEHLPLLLDFECMNNPASALHYSLLQNVSTQVEVSSQNPVPCEDKTSMGDDLPTHLLKKQKM